MKKKSKKQTEKVDKSDKKLLLYNVSKSIKHGKNCAYTDTMCQECMVEWVAVTCRD